MTDEYESYAEALRCLVHRMSISELVEAVGGSATTWKRIRRHCKEQGWSDYGQPMANLWPRHGQAMANSGGKPEVSPSSLDITSPKGEEPMAQLARPRDELFDQWAENIHPRQLNYAKRYNLDLEDIVLQYRSFVLGSEKGLQVVDFGEKFWAFIQTAKRDAEARARKDADFKARQDQIDRERRQRFAKPPGAQEHDENYGRPAAAAYKLFGAGTKRMP